MNGNRVVKVKEGVLNTIILAIHPNITVTRISRNVFPMALNADSFAVNLDRFLKTITL